MARNKRTRLVKETTTIDYSTGEIKNHEYSSVRFSTAEPPYVKLYIEDLSRLYNIPSGAKDLIYALVQRMDYQGYVALNKAYKDIICESIAVKDQTFRNHLTRLSNEGILRIVGKGLYQMNPDLFARGAWEDIEQNRKNYRLTVSYDRNGDRKVTGEAS